MSDQPTYHGRTAAEIEADIELVHGPEQLEHIRNQSCCHWRNWSELDMAALRDLAERKRGERKNPK